jgi:hypothetical protein
VIAATPIGGYAAVVALALAGCVRERTKAGPVRIPEGALAGAVREGGRAGTRAQVVAVAKPAAPAPAAAPAPVAAPAAVVRSPPAGDAAPAAHRPLAAGKTLEEVAREKFLSAATTIDAEKATVTVPAALAAEASLRGTTVREDGGPNRRVAEGVAVLTLRRLTVKARRIVLVARDDGKDDVQVSARGNASLESDQPASVVHESGLKALLLTNDGYVPLR